MITIFRKIRQKLAYENKLSKYLRYAFGEIILNLYQNSPFLVHSNLPVCFRIRFWDKNEVQSEKEQCPKKVCYNCATLLSITVHLCPIKLKNLGG